MIRLARRGEYEDGLGLAAPYVTVFGRRCQVSALMWFDVAAWLLESNSQGYVPVSRGTR